MSSHPEFQAVIGLEVHCQLSTASKIFCACPARLDKGKSVADLGPNSNTCPICAGHPGTLPVLNRKVVEFAVRAGVATNCTINKKNVFSRKNYFYPDLPKGYQISQYDQPICENGELDIETQAGSKTVRIQRIHIEEDAGKNIHMSGFSLVNLNRAGVPLIEIVSAPDMTTAEEASAYLRALYAVVTYLDICDGNLQEGNFRCDANVSVMLKGSAQFGTRAEIKNVNSFKFVEKAIDYEIARQIGVVRSGGRVIQETRGYDAARNVTVSQRSKEEAQDYRYFPEPDLIPIQIDPAWVDEIRSALPELPESKKRRYVQDWGLSTGDASVLTASRALTVFFEQVVQKLKESGADLKKTAKPAANWISGEVVRLLNEADREIHQSGLTPKHLADLVLLTASHVISSTGAKQALAICCETGEDIESIVQREGLRQVSDTGALEVVILKILSAHPGQVAEYRSGKEKLLGFFVGQAMKEMSGKGNPALLQEIIKKKLGEGNS